MSSMGLRAGRRAERRSRRLKTLRFLSIVAVFVTLGFLAYQSGTQLAAIETGQLRREIGTLQQTVQALTVRAQAMEAERNAALAREAEALARYRRDVPTGPARDVFAAAVARIEAGLPPERLAFLIRAASDGRKCEDEAQTKRFVVQTPLSRGSNNWVGFDGAGIVITAEGEPAVSPQGARQAWFDPARPLKVLFTQPGGQRSEANGVLPMHHSVLRQGSEYRFTVTEGEVRGMVQVTAEICAYP